jgi:hypothetical protein
VAAQPGTQEEKTEVTIGNKKITIEADTSGGPNKYSITKVENADTVEKHRFSHVGFMALDLGFNSLLHDGSFNFPDSLGNFETRPFNSANVSLHFLPTRIAMAKGHVNLITALTFDISQYAWDKNVYMMADTNRVVMVEGDVKYDKTKLTSYYLQVPLMLNFQTSPGKDRKNFTFSVGGYAGLLTGAKSKIKFEDGDKLKTRDDYNLNKIRYGVTARIGYSHLEFANYNLSDFFQDNRGPQFNSITFGVGLIGLTTLGD